MNPKRKTITLAALATLAIAAFPFAAQASKPQAISLTFTMHFTTATTATFPFNGCMLHLRLSHAVPTQGEASYRRHPDIFCQGKSEFSQQIERRPVLNEGGTLECGSLLPLSPRELAPVD